MTDHAFHVVDVFTDRPFGGNPLAVFPDARGIPESLFQAIAREFNLSETTFVLPPEDEANHCKVRIFTPAAELPMAGHPTVGTAFVLVREGILDPSASGGVLRFEEGVGLVPVTVEPGPRGSRDPGRITMTQPLPRFGPVFDDREAIAALLGLKPGDLLSGAPVQSVSCGVPFCLVPLRSLDAVARANLQTALWERALKAWVANAVLVFSRETDSPGHHVHARMFAPAFGVQEDPATGSAAGPLGCYLIHHGLVDSPAGVGDVDLVCEQGVEMGRPSLLNIGLSLDTESSNAGGITGVRVGGHAVPVSRGVMHL